MCGRHNAEMYQNSSQSCIFGLFNHYRLTSPVQNIPLGAMHYGKCSIFSLIQWLLNPYILKIFQYFKIIKHYDHDDSTPLWKWHFLGVSFPRQWWSILVILTSTWLVLADDNRLSCCCNFSISCRISSFCSKHFRRPSLLAKRNT